MLTPHFFFWNARLSLSKKFPTYPWNIPHTLNQHSMKEFLPFRVFEDSWGMLQEYVGDPCWWISTQKTDHQGSEKGHLIFFSHKTTPDQEGWGLSPGEMKSPRLSTVLMHFPVGKKTKIAGEVKFILGKNMSSPKDDMKTPWHPGLEFALNVLIDQGLIDQIKVPELGAVRNPNVPSSGLNPLPQKRSCKGNNGLCVKMIFLFMKPNNYLEDHPS